MPHLNKRQRLVLAWTLASAVVLAALIGWSMLRRPSGGAAVLPGQRVEGLTSVLTREATGGQSPILFRDVTAGSGITFTHFPAVRASLLPEDMGSGVAAGDYDQDGLLDLLFVNFAGSILEPAPRDRAAARSRLYRNLGGMRFEDVTERSGLDFAGFGLGAAWGDLDGDGDLDLYISAYGKDALYENRGDGTFADITGRSGTGDPRFGAGAAWADYDRDGDLDLYVSNYVDFVFRDADRGMMSRQYGSEQPYTLNPSAYPSPPNSLYRNRGDGTFDEVAAAAGVANPSGRSLAASWLDMNNDGWPDLYVANDVSENGVFLNRGDGTFEDVGASSLAADYRGAMGLAVCDFDNDLDLDLLITHWIAQENALYRNMLLDPMAKPGDARLWFLDAADELGLGQLSLDMVGWATGFADLDNDGRRDLWIVNGSTFEQVADHRRLEPQRPFIFWNRGADGFVELGARALGPAAGAFVGRGGLQADLDRDGRIDLVWAVHGGHPILLRNESAGGGHWLRLALRQRRGNTEALGARAYLTAAGATQMAEIGGECSYLSQSERILHFGLGAVASATELRIVWPDGTEEIHRDLEVDRLLEFVHDPGSPGA
jgi:hypothetical protein